MSTSAGGGDGGRGGGWRGGWGMGKSVEIFENENEKQQEKGKKKKERKKAANSCASGGLDGIPSTAVYPAPMANVNTFSHPLISLLEITIAGFYSMGIAGKESEGELEGADK